MSFFAAASDAWIKPGWPAPDRVRALTTTRRLPGNSLPPFDAFNLGLRSGEDEGIVRANRALLERAFALPSPPRWMRQVHGTHAAAFDATSSTEIVQADAAFTTTSGVVLALLSADCLPILICSESGDEIATIHAGWRGLAAGAIEACIRKVSTPRARLLAWLGPAIGPNSYEIGEEVRAAFVDRDASATVAFSATRPGHWNCDLYTLARLRLRDVCVERVFGGELDTFSDSRFYSFRRDGSRSGRFASLIWMDES